MHKTLFFSIICIIFLTQCQQKKTTEVEEVPPSFIETLPAAVQTTLAFHDANVMYNQTEIKCSIVSTTAKDTTERKREIKFDTQAGTFLMSQLKNRQQEVFQVPIPDEITDSTTIARSLMYKKYFRYMLGGSIVLSDSTAFIHEIAKDTLFNGMAAKEISVTYEPKDKMPHWYFIVNATNGEMLQSRFIYNEGKENQRGEYINYGPYVTYKEMKLTSALNWFYLNGEFLASEKITYLN